MHARKPAAGDKGVTDKVAFIGSGVEKSTRYAEQVRAERAAEASKALDVSTSQVVSAILAHSSQDQANAVLDMLNDAGELSVSTACMVAGQLIANIAMRVEKQGITTYIGGIVRLALQIVEGHNEMAELAAAIPAGAA